MKGWWFLLVLLVACTPVEPAVPAPLPAPEPIEPPAEPELPVQAPEQNETAPLAAEITLEADDDGFYPGNIITVPEGTHVTLRFHIRDQNVRRDGLRIRSKYFDTGPVFSDSFATVNFTATEDFPFASYWPDADVLAATGRVDVI